MKSIVNVVLTTCSLAVAGVADYFKEKMSNGTETVIHIAMNALRMTTMILVLIILKSQMLNGN